MDDSTLKSLKVFVKGTKEELVLTPLFSRHIKQYSSCCASDVDAITVQASPFESDAFSQVQKLSSDASNILKEGANSIDIKVDAADSSFSIYSIEIYRPSPSDSTIKEIILLDEHISLVPDFHRLEINYILKVSGVSRTSLMGIKVIPMNSKSKITINEIPRDEVKDLPLSIGDTLLSIKVTAADGKNSTEYNVIARKEKPGFRPNITPISSKLTCSLCNSIVFRPRTLCVLHILCCTCIDLVSKEGKRACPFCGALSKDLPDAGTEMELGKLLVKTCPYSAYGCKETNMEYSLVSGHVDKCSYFPVECTECNFLAPKFDLDDTSKHKLICTIVCECGKKVATRDKKYHEKICQLNVPVSKPTLSYTASKWEAELVDSKMYGSSLNSVQEIFKKIETGKEKHSSLLKTALKSLQSSSSAIVHLDTSILNDLSKMFATILSIYSDSKRSPSEISQYSLILALNLEETLLCNEYFPNSVIQSQSGKNCNEEATDGFFSDEVDGLLNSLGIEPGASDTLKIKALEGEFHRLLENGNSDKAAEVQGLHDWKVKKVAANSGILICGIDAKNKKNGMQSMAGYSNIREKLKHAVDLDECSVEANFHYARVLFSIEKYGEAEVIARKALGLNPRSNKCKELLANCIVALQDEENITEAIEYLTESIERYRFNFWKTGSFIGDPKHTRLSDVQYKPFIQSCLSLSRAQYLKAQTQISTLPLMDALYLIPDHMIQLNRKSIQLLYSFIDLCNVQMIITSTSDEQQLRQSLYFLTQFISDSFNSLDNTGMIQNLKEDVSKTLVFKVPNNTKYLEMLGCSQLEKIETLTEYELLTNEALISLNNCEQSFLAVIDVENGLTSTDKITSQSWWKEYIKKFDVKKEPEEVQVTKKAIEGKKAVGEKTPKIAPSPKQQTSLMKKKTEISVKEPAKTPSKTTKIPTARQYKSATSPVPKIAVPPPKSAIKAADAIKTAVSRPTSALKTTAGSPNPLARPIIAAKTSTRPVSAIKQSRPSSAKISSASKLASKSRPITAPIKFQKSYTTRIGLARILSKKLAILESKSELIQTPKDDLYKNCVKYYNEAMLLNPAYHDIYIELGALMEKYSSLSEAADIYGSFPFDKTKEDEEQDNLYIYGEIVRSFMKEKRYKDPILINAMINQGKVMGISILEKHVETLDKASEYETLMEVYSKVSKKSREDSDMIAFFKARFWL